MVTAATYRGTVYPWQCDHVGHMSIMWYVGEDMIRRTAARQLAFPDPVGA